MNTRSHLQPKPTSSFTPVSSRLLQRKCACGGSAGLAGKCTECENKRLTLQRRSNNQTEPDEVPPIVHEVLRESGQPLDTETRAFMEPRFGHDFSQVRVHTDEKAAESTQAVNALAYTVGRDIIFRAGQYDPQTITGKRLLAHELTHVVQQHQLNQFSPKSLRGDRNIVFEQEADQIANVIVSEHMTRVTERLNTPLIQKQESGEDLTSKGEEENLGDFEENSDEQTPVQQQDNLIKTPKKCSGIRNLSFLIKNFKDIDFTVPVGCKAKVTCTAIWVPVGGPGGIECCTGKDTYIVELNKVKHSMSAGANVCGDDAEHKKGVDFFEVGSGRHNGKIQVDRSNCEGIALDIKMNIEIHS